MTESPAEREAPVIDWEAFYRSYRTPGYVPGYEITSKLGGGMFGLVFKARKQSIGKDYAIKFLKVDDDEVRRALFAEWETVRHFAQVDHPNLVSIEDRGEVDGIPYIVMAYAGDRTLRDRLAAPDADREELLLYFLQACRGVQALHERSLVHFDLKPANIFLRGTVARVGDYGLSKLVAHSRNTLSMGRGTPYYMAPEILRNQGDKRSDIYSLGIILYECLTGEVPFQGDSEWEVLRKHESATPDYPPDLPLLYRQVLERCLDKSPDRRFASVADLLQALQTGAAPGLGRGPEPQPQPHPHPEPHSEPEPPPDPDAARQARDEALRGMGAAARDFSKHAQTAATDAVKSVRVAGRRAFRQARRAVRARMREQPGHWHRSGSWGWLSWRLVGLGGRRRRPPHQALWKPAFVLALVFTMVAALLFVTPGGGLRMERERSASAAPSPRPDPRGWMLLARAGDPSAGSVLRRQLASFRSQLPDSVTALQRRAAPLPEVPLEFADPRVAPEQALQYARAFADAADGDEAAAAMEKTGYAGVLGAILLLETLDTLDPDDLRRAARLNAYLQRALRFDGINVATVGPPGTWHELNRRAPQLWRWFVREHLGDADTYRLYRDALK